MPRYRKRPVVIEAFQMTKERRDQRGWPTWLNEAWMLKKHLMGALYMSGPDGAFSIKTLEGAQLVSWDDYIIQGVEGELYPCKPRIFNRTYEKVTA